MGDIFLVCTHEFRMYPKSILELMLFIRYLRWMIVKWRGWRSIYPVKAIFVIRVGFPCKVSDKTRNYQIGKIVACPRRNRDSNNFENVRHVGTLELSMYSNLNRISWHFFIISFPHIWISGNTLYTEHELYGKNDL